MMRLADRAGLFDARRIANSERTADQWTIMKLKLLGRGKIVALDADGSILEQRDLEQLVDRFDIAEATGIIYRVATDVSRGCIALTSIR